MVEIYFIFMIIVFANSCTTNVEVPVRKLDTHNLRCTGVIETKQQLRNYILKSDCMMGHIKMHDGGIVVATKIGDDDTRIKLIQKNANMYLAYRSILPIQLIIKIRAVNVNTYYWCAGRKRESVVA